jgi:glycosyltransferase involved in cell wall biosynthesis
MSWIHGDSRTSLISFHPRKQHNFQQAAVLSELFPKRFKHVTSVYFSPALINFIKKISPRLAAQMGKRSYPKLPGKFVNILPSTEITRWRRERKYGLSNLSDYMSLNEMWQQSVLKHYRPPGVCISYDGISNLLFRKWKNKTTLILDLAIGLPQYRVKIEFGDRFNNVMLDDVDEVRKRLFTGYTEEVKLADIILCGSEFVKKTVCYFFPECETKCKILPYGTELEEFSFPERKFEQRNSLKFVFVGRLSWRKGAHQMLDTWKEFVIDHPESELHFFGTADKEIVLDPLPDKVFIHGRVGTSELIAHLKTMDVFVFPTTFEGSSIAVFQAMALKLPVITTVNSGTVLQHGESCEIVEAGDKTGLINAMDKLLHDSSYREKIAENAFALSKNYSWDDYRNRLEEILSEVNFKTREN